MPKPEKLPKAEPDTKLFETSEEFAVWLETHHADTPGVWLRLAKKASSLRSISYAEALDCALCYGWIDGLKRSHDEDSWLQKFTPRGAKSLWSKINREKVTKLIETSQMQAAGLQEVERAKTDGRWDAAYDSARTAEVPDDFLAELDKNAVAKEFFVSLNGTNRYAVLWRIQTAKKAETRAKRIQQFVAMLERHEKIHP